MAWLCTSSWTSDNGLAAEATDYQAEIARAVRIVQQAAPDDWKLLEITEDASPPGYLLSEKVGVKVVLRGPAHGVTQDRKNGVNKRTNLPKECLTIWVMPGDYPAHRAFFPLAFIPAFQPEDASPEIGRSKNVRVFERNTSHVISWKTYQQDLIAALQLTRPSHRREPLPAYGYD